MKIIEQWLIKRMYEGRLIYETFTNTPKSKIKKDMLLEYLWINRKGLEITTFFKDGSKSKEMLGREWLSQPLD